MSKLTQFVFLLMVMIAFSGCNTIQGGAVGAATGFQQDIHNVADPNCNGWNVIQKADAWVRQNMW